MVMDSNASQGIDKQKKLTELKKQVENSYQWWKLNADRYNFFMRFVFDTALTNDDMAKLQQLKKPNIECNIIEAMVSRLIGEFAKHEPTVNVRAEDGVSVEKLTPDYLMMMKFLEAHMRHEITDSTSDGLQEKLYKDTLGGGYTVAKVFTDYISPMSFDQKIMVQRAHDPTLCGFDPLAKESHKGDGNYCYELYPMSKEDFAAKYGEKALEGLKMSRSIGPYAFTWSYKQLEQDVIMVCEFFMKKKKRKKLVKLSNGHIVLKKHYEKDLLPMWEQMGFIEQPPIIIEERMTEIEVIERYHFCETMILDYVETDYRLLPLVFIDGNSVEVRDPANNSSAQMTRPYAYHAKGIQQLFNFAVQTVAQEIENIVQHKFIVPLEAIPKNYMRAYQDIQTANTLIYNQFYKDNPEIRLDAPREIQRTPTPPIVESVFNGSNRIMQNVLGAYDAVLGANEMDVSGKAINQGAIQSSAASAPYLSGYIRGLNRIAQIMLDLIPKYYVTPRSLPIILPDGKRSYQTVNKPDDENSFELRYQPHELNVKVEAGVNTSIQKQVAIDQIIRMMQSSELFANFINTQGLETMLDNLEIRGIEDMKSKAAQYMQQLQQQQEQQAQQGDPMQKMLEAQMQVEMAHVEQKREEAQTNAMIKAAQVSVEQEKAETQRAVALNEIEDKQARTILEQQKIVAEQERSAVELAMNAMEASVKQKESNEQPKPTE